MTQLQVHCLALCCLLAAIPSEVLGGGFAHFSKHEELRGHVIVDVGDFEKINLPIGKFVGQEFLRFGANCFQTMGIIGLWGLDKKAGLVVVDKSRSVKIAFIDLGMGEIKIDIVQVLQVACPMSDSDGLSQSPLQRQQELMRHDDELQMKIERILQKKR